MESNIPKVSPTRRLALRFISGKYQGGEVPLNDPQEIIVGRSSDLDMVLVEDMVSRRHARISHADQKITIEDLGSTNGTFVNGERIKRAYLKEGDRVLIGTSILKVVPVDSSTPARRRESIPAAGRATMARGMSGAIDEIPLPDLLQLLGSSKKTGELMVQSDGDVGKIHLRQGIICHASINDDEDVTPLKSAYRILTWTRGLFEFEPPPDGQDLPSAMSVSVQELLMEGLRQIDEFNAIRHKLPDLDARITVVQPLLAPLKDLSPAELDIFQIAYNTATIAAVLNKSLESDLDTARGLIKLLGSGYLRHE